MKTRQESNREILEFLKLSIEANPNFRFHQLLQNKNFILRSENGTAVKDEFYVESEKILKRLKSCYTS